MNRVLRPFTALSPRLHRLLAGALGAMLLFVVVANVHVMRANRDRLYTALDAVPARETGLVLGANATLPDGRANLYFVARMDAAAELYHAGKVRRLLVSGDNGRPGYDEPSMMKAALVARGVPAAAIVCDYAGFRTLDSVIRAHDVFRLNACTIITQRYHNTRALEIARARGIDAVGFCAEDVRLHTFRLRAELREVMARTVAVLDLYVWHRQPHFPGPPEPFRPLSS